MGKNILVVVDMQHDFVDGTLKNHAAQAIVPVIIDEIKSGKYDYTILTFDTHYKNYFETLEGQKLPVKHCIKGTEGWFVLDEIRNLVTAKNGEWVYKETFGSKELPYVIFDYVNGQELVDPSMENTTITFVGTCTDICVISNALLCRTHFPNTKIMVLKDATAATTPEMQEAALKVMQSCQIDVL